MGEDCSFLVAFAAAPRASKPPSTIVVWLLPLAVALILAALSSDGGSGVNLGTQQNTRVSQITCEAAAVSVGTRLASTDRKGAEVADVNMGLGTSAATARTHGRGDPSRSGRCSNSNRRRNHREGLGASLKTEAARESIQIPERGGGMRWVGIAEGMGGMRKRTDVSVEGVVRRERGSVDRSGVAQSFFAFEDSHSEKLEVRG